jgi:TolB-like protein/tRNA A-37 threonylcarbamoyl transferase component Bud32/Flp pilus assembly protein TadD
MTLNWQQVKQLFDAALERDRSSRNTFLSDACGGNRELQKKVEQLLAAHEQAGSFLAVPRTGSLGAAETPIAANTDTQPLTFEKLGRFSIVERIGSGAMGVVYRARDERLDREVAVKVLPAKALADPVARKRFRREAQALAKLNHPHIAAVFDFDTEGGVDFLVIEFVEGMTLADLLAARPMPEKQVVDLGSQLAAALEEAHERGVIHRDLKPGNIIVNAKGQAKVLDFGLAKLLRPGTESTATETNTVAGTLPYMAPELLRGEMVDPRTDIYALGVILYEISTGRRPFEASVSTALIDDILHKPLVPPRRVCPHVSAQLEKIILKCLDREPENRYRSAQELGLDLGHLSSATSTGGMLPAVRVRIGWKPIAGAGAAIVMTGALLAGLNPRWRNQLIGPAAPRIESLAVLPLENLSADPEQEYFADGMTGAVIADLAQIGALKVISRTSAMHYKGVHKPLPEIARELRVDAIVEGTVQRLENRVRITVQLIDAPNDRHLWARSYERSLRDVMALQGEVAQAIAQEIRLKLKPQERARLANARMVDPEAHEAYLKGLYHFNKLTEKELGLGIDYFKRAIDKDPHHALAYAGLATSYAALADFYRPPSETLPNTKAAAIKALEIDETLAEPHALLAYASFYYDWDWSAAERELRRAIELNPGYAFAHDLYGRYLSAIGRRDEALVEVKRSHQLDPFSLLINTDAAWSFLMMRRYDDSIGQSRKALEVEPNFAWAHTLLGLGLAQKREFSEAVAEAEKGRQLDDSPLIAAGLAYVYAVSGHAAKAETLLSELKETAKRRYVCPYEIGSAYVGLGKTDEAFRLLEDGYQVRSQCMVFLKVDPRMDPIRSDHRFQDLMRRIGLSL